MSVVLPDLSLWRQRLQEEVPTLMDVGGAADFASATTKGALRTPSAYVFLSSDQPASNSLATALRQQVQSRVTVVLAVRNVRDSSGESAADALTVYRADVMDALLDWQPSSALGSVQYMGGRLLSLDQAVLWWGDEFAFDYWLSVT